MKILFENNINKIEFSKLMKDMLINIPISALIFSMFIFIFTWKKPSIIQILIFILILTVLKLIRFLTSNFSNHLERITLDYENEKIIINHIRPSIKRTEIIMNLKEIKVSKIKHPPISWFSFANYFWISDEKSKIKISTASHDNKEINLNEIHTKLDNTQKNYR